MISASEIHELRFEKAAFGYKQEDIDEFLNRLEEEADIAQQELDDANNKIQVLADKVREYMRDEDALKDALLGAQKEAHRIVDEASERADEIIAKARAKADAMMEEVTVQHDTLMEKNAKELEEEKQRLIDARHQVGEFKRALLDMYKGHLRTIAAIPDEDDMDFGTAPREPQPAPIPATPSLHEKIADQPSQKDPFSGQNYSAKTIQGAFDSRFGDLQDPTDDKN